MQLHRLSCPTHGPPFFFNLIGYSLRGEEDAAQRSVQEARKNSSARGQCPMAVERAVGASSLQAAVCRAGKKGSSGRNNAFAILVHANLPSKKYDTTPRTDLVHLADVARCFPFARVVAFRFEPL